MNASSLGDISTDDNAVDMPIKQEEDPASLGLTNSNDRIPILDDDDDVIVLPQEEPVIEEIMDDDDHQVKEIPATEELGGVKRDSGVTLQSCDTGISTQPDNEVENGSLNSCFVFFLLRVSAVFQCFFLF